MIEKMIKSTRMKQINCFKLWHNHCKSLTKLSADMEKIKEIQKKFLTKLLGTKAGRLVDAL